MYVRFKLLKSLYSVNKLFFMDFWLLWVILSFQCYEQCIFLTFGNCTYPQCTASSFNTYIYIGGNYPLTINSISISICHFFVLEPFSAFILILYKILNKFLCPLTTLSALLIYLIVDFFFWNLRHTLKNETQGMEDYMFRLFSS